MNDDESESDYSDTSSIDSCEEYINFESIRNPSTQLEEAIRFSWPGIYEEGDDDDDGDDDDGDDDDDVEGEEKEEEGKMKKKKRRSRKKILLSTLMEEEDLAPLFDGSRWAGTRLWGAAVRCIQYLSGNLMPPPGPGGGGGEGGGGVVEADHHDPTTTTTTTTAAAIVGGIEQLLPKIDASVTMLELGCGLGVPGMVFHLLGGNAVLTDQIDILSQLEKNVVENFPHTTSPSSSSSSSARSPISSSGESSTSDDDEGRRGGGGGGGATMATIRAMPLSWSRDEINVLLEKLGRSSTGFDVVINCDCVYEPLYGKSWHLLNETIDELLKVNPQCLVVSSMERRSCDGIDDFIEEMRNMDHVGSVDRVWFEEGKKIEIYVTTSKKKKKLPSVTSC